MKFALANKAPITVNIDGTDYALKRFTRGDWINWASEIDGQRTAEATAGLDSVQRSRLLLIYSIEPTTHAELNRRVYTPDGVGRIIRTCAEKSAVPKEVIDKALDSEADEKDLETLAMMLASIIDPAETKTVKDADGKSESADPLKSSAAA